MARVTTRTGDEGYTDLLGSGRVPKYHRRPEAYGTLDEATSALGLARAQSPDAWLKDQLYHCQRDLYTLMAELATPPENYEKVDWKIRAEDVDFLDQLGDELKMRVEIGKEFIVPGATVVGASLDLARTIVRRGERQVARLYHERDITNVEALRYLNRLSDVLFILARYEEKGAPHAAR
ncbi:MAG: cob(I)yrinic acid a,c-diamide adenosyltransferase [Chloroflexota bacterium]